MVIFSLISPPPCNGRFWYQYDYEDRELNCKNICQIFVGMNGTCLRLQDGNKGNKQILFGLVFQWVFVCPYKFVYLKCLFGGGTPSNAHSFLMVLCSWSTHGTFRDHMGCPVIELRFSAWESNALPPCSISLIIKL